MKKIFAISLMIFSFASLMAQPGPDKDKKREGKQKIKALYTAYITQELNLSQDESAKFWAIHNEFNAEMKEANRKETNELDREEATLTIKRKYSKRFASVIGPDRTNQFFKKDGEFRRQLTDKIKEKKGGQGKQRNREALEVAPNN